MGSGVSDKGLLVCLNEGSGGTMWNGLSFGSIWLRFLV